MPKPVIWFTTTTTTTWNTFQHLYLLSASCEWVSDFLNKCFKCFALSADNKRLKFFKWAGKFLFEFEFKSGLEFKFESECEFEMLFLLLASTEYKILFFFSCKRMAREGPKSAFLSLAAKKERFLHIRWKKKNTKCSYLQNIINMRNKFKSQYLHRPFSLSLSWIIALIDNQ